MCQKELDIRKIDGQDALLRPLRREDRIHFDKIAPAQFQCKEIVIGAAIENGPVGDRLFLLAFARFKLDLALKVDILRQEQAEVDVMVERPDGHG